MTEFYLREYCLAAWNVLYILFLQKLIRRVCSVDMCSVAASTQVQGMEIWTKVEVLITCILKLGLRKSPPVTIQLGAALKIVDPRGYFH